MEPAQANIRTHMQLSDPGGSQAAVTATLREPVEKPSDVNDTKAFIGKTTQPTPAEFSPALGAAAPVSEELLSRLRDEQKITVGEWTSSSPQIWMGASDETEEARHRVHGAG